MAAERECSHLCVNSLYGWLVVKDDFETDAVWFDGQMNDEIQENDRIAIPLENAVKVFKLEKILSLL